MNKFMSSIGLVCLLFGVANAEVISKDGIATDTVTGLMWQDNKETKSKKFTNQQGISYCSSLELNGHNDWRLPSIYELITLIDTNKSIDPYVISGLKNIDSTGYWSATANANNSGNKWVVNFNFSNMYYIFKDDGNNIRCVRGKEITYDSLSSLLKNGRLTIPFEMIEKISQNNLDLAEKQYNEIELYKYAINTRSIDSYANYLKKYPHGKFSQEIRSTYDKLLYDQVSSENTIKSYKAYLKEYPNGEYTSSARSNIQYLEEENRFRALLQSKSPQTIYIEAGKQERNGNTSKANKLYEAIIDRFPNSDFAVKASDKLTSANRAENEASNRRSQSRQECENNKRACIAGCGGFISGADSHNSNMWQCKNKCEQISCY